MRYTNLPCRKVKTSFKATENLDTCSGPELVYDALDPFHDAASEHGLLFGRTHPPSEVLYLIVQSYNVRGVDLGFPGRIRVGEEGGKQVAPIFRQFVSSFPLALGCLVTVVAITFVSTTIEPDEILSLPAVVPY